MTLAFSYRDQGLEYLEDAENLALDDLLVPFNPQHAEELAASLTAELHAAQQASAEGPVQEMMLALVHKVQGLTHLPGRQYADTSQTGLPILPAGRRAKPDLAGYEVFPSATKVSIISEAKPTLASSKHDGEAAYQVVQCALQLQAQQPARTKWAFASLGRDSVTRYWKPCVLKSATVLGDAQGWRAAICCMCKSCNQPELQNLLVHLPLHPSYKCVHVSSCKAPCSAYATLPAAADDATFLFPVFLL